MYVTTYALNLAVLWLGLTVQGWPVALAQTTAMIVYTVCFFVGCKVLVFWRPEDQRKEQRRDTVSQR